MMKALWVTGMFVVASIYLFVTAPIPLEDHVTYRISEATVPITEVFDVLNTINAQTRKIYTNKIVGHGKQAGLLFSEHWANTDVYAGPLPALFLRLTSQKLHAQKSELGLYLGSDQPINASNYFKGIQIQEFNLLKADQSHQARFFEMKQLGLQIGMFGDVASASGCVSCHNDHRDSPKKNWKLNDIMGATTWTYPRQFVTNIEAQRMISELYNAIFSAYSVFLLKASTYQPRIKIAKQWPSQGVRALPDNETFRQTVLQVTAPQVVDFVFVKNMARPQGKVER